MSTVYSPPYTKSNYKKKQRRTSTKETKDLQTASDYFNSPTTNHKRKYSDNVCDLTAISLNFNLEKDIKQTNCKNIDNKFDNIEIKKHRTKSMMHQRNKSELSTNISRNSKIKSFKRVNFDRKNFISIILVESFKRFNADISINNNIEKNKNENFGSRNQNKTGCKCFIF